jgi:hypothetical protein
MVFWEGVLVVLVLVLVPLVLVHTADEPDAVVPAHYFRAPPKKGWGMSPEDRTALEEQLRALPLELAGVADCGSAPPPAPSVLY